MNDILTVDVLVASLLAIVALVLLDLIVRVAVSIYRKVFEWGKVLEFLRTNVIPYVIAFGGVEGVLFAAQYVSFPDSVVAPFAGVAALIYALIVARLIGSIYASLRELGLPVQEE